MSDLGGDLGSLEHGARGAVEIQVAAVGDGDAAGSPPAACHSDEVRRSSAVSSAWVRSRLKPHGARSITSASDSSEGFSSTVEWPPRVPCTIVQLA